MQDPTAATRPMMTIQESVKTCIRKYADFSGRATRAEYWWWVLATTVAGFAIGAIDGFINSVTGPYSFSPLSAIFGLAVLLPDLAVTARRLHDTGRSGWWQLVWFVVAVLGAIPLVIGVAATIISAMSGDSWWGHPSFWIPVIIGAAVSFLIWLGIFIWWIVWMVQQGQPGPNHYGPDPRAWDEAVAGQPPLG